MSYTNTIDNSILDRLGVWYEESLPCNPVVRWNHFDPVGTIKIESAETPFDSDKFDSETDYDICAFGSEASESEPLTDEEWVQLLDVLEFGSDDHLVEGRE